MLNKASLFFSRIYSEEMEAKGVKGLGEKSTSNYREDGANIYWTYLLCDNPLNILIFKHHISLCGRRYPIFIDKKLIVMINSPFLMSYSKLWSADLFDFKPHASLTRACCILILLITTTVFNSDKSLEKTEKKFVRNIVIWRAECSYTVCRMRIYVIIGEVEWRM